MNDEQLLRYSRHLLINEIDYEGQEKLLGARVLVIGLGGLGSPVALYLGASGIGHLVLCDNDLVELGNLQRQIAHRTADIGRLKAHSARATVLSLNPGIRVDAITERMSGEALRAQVGAADVVVDASDNFETRFAINAACVATGTPLVTGSVIQLRGQVTTIDPRQTTLPCYRCLFDENASQTETCSETGVLAPLAGIVASIQATEVIKLLIPFGQTLSGRLVLIDGANMNIRTVLLHKDPACPVCSRINAAQPPHILSR